MASQKSSFRSEKDALGTVKVPKEAYYGAFYTRAQKNFQISKLRIDQEFRIALGQVKLAALMSNSSIGLIDKKKSQAIEKACKEFIEGKFDQSFDLDVFQAGAGTSYNMSCNEIIANRANEILKAPKGEYSIVNPNNHVNMAQSTNDVIPTVTRMATLKMTKDLIIQSTNLEKSLQKIAAKNKNLLKVGRTHLQDAVPITLGQEFDSYKEALIKSRKFIETTSKDLQTLGIGGTAVGTGINTHTRYKGLMIKNLSKIAKIKFSSAKNLTEIANNMNSFMNFSSALRSLATNLLNIANDLKLMNMGPKAGLAEISLPEVQPGSSIMPGKINPSIPECLEMICFKVLGNDHSISLAAQRSQFELNVMCPLIAYSLLESIEILTNGLRMFNEYCVKDIKVNIDRISDLYAGSLVTATALAPILGYQETSNIVKTALKKGITIREETALRKHLTTKKLDEALSVNRLTKPSK